MNKQEFIDSLSQHASFLSSHELSDIKDYLNERLEDESVPCDAELFVKNMKLSFELFRYLNETEALRHSEMFAKSVNEIMSNDDDNKTDTPSQEHTENSQTQTESFPREDENIHKNEKRGGFISFINGMSKTNRVLVSICCIAVLILLLPIFGIGAAVCVALYMIPLTLILAIWLLIMAIDAAFALLGTVAVSYGIANLFVSAPVGIIEIGLGTVLFSLMLAVWALNYQFVSTVVPATAKCAASLIKKAFTLIKEFIFGKMEAES
ncbi:MAG: hypothetical protein E7588_07465 [Ruminococcaceae bacterium]|nr:hypothetical protein [Oscillospiraceae bacterium]